MTVETYRNNIYLKKVGQQIEFSEFEISEWIKCSNDPLYFIKTYVMIITKDNGIIPFGQVIHPFQEDLIKLFHKERFVISKVFRQAGKCLNYDTKIKIRNKKTGHIYEVQIGKLFEDIKNKNFPTS